MEKLPTTPSSEPKRLEVIPDARIPEGMDKLKHPIERPVKELFGRLMDDGAVAFFNKLTDQYGEEGAKLIARQSCFDQGELVLLGVSKLTITELPKDIPDTVFEISAEKTHIKRIDVLPPKLEYLNISDSSVEEIPPEVFPVTLRILRCEGTPFSENEVKFDPKGFLEDLREYAPDLRVWY